MVGGRGLEPPFLTEPVPKTGVSTISPPARLSILVVTNILLVVTRKISRPRLGCFAS